MSETDSELNARSLKEILSLTSTLRSGYEKLVAENDKLRAALDWYLEWYTKERAMSDELHLPPEIESLRQAYLSALRGWTGEIERLRTEAARLSAENEQFRVQDETIRAEFGGKRDGRPTIECLRDAFAAKWSEEDTLFKATLDMKTGELWAEVARLAAENEKLRAEVQKLDSECTDLATDLSTQRQDNASLAEPWKVVNPLQAEVERLAAENERLRTALVKAQSFIRGEHAMMKAYFSLHDEGVPVRECDVRHMQRTGKLADELDAVLSRAALQDKSDE